MSATEKRPYLIAALASVLLILAVSLFYIFRDKESVTYTRIKMGTVVQVTLMEGGKSGFDNAAEAAFAEVDRLEAIFSSYKAQSDVSRISKAAGIETVKVSPEVIDVLETAVKVAGLSGGAFDPTVGALGKVWGFSGESGRVPDKKNVASLLPLVDYRKIIIDRKDSKAGLKEKGMVLNLGGVAKGYIMERAALVLKEHGVKRAIVHAGGDMYMFREDGKRPFTIGIRHPREDRLMAEAFVDGGAVSTSGDYERFFMKDGVRYHHILDPKTGFPADRTRGVTVIAKDGALADALSTAAFVVGGKEGLALIERLGAEGLLVDSDGRVFTTRGFKGRVLQ